MRQRHTNEQVQTTTCTIPSGFFPYSICQDTYVIQTKSITLERVAGQTFINNTQYSQFIHNSSCYTVSSSRMSCVQFSWVELYGVHIILCNFVFEILTNRFFCLRWCIMLGGQYFMLATICLRTKYVWKFPICFECDLVHTNFSTSLSSM